MKLGTIFFKNLYCTFQILVIIFIFVTFIGCAINDSPVANAGSDQNVPVGSLVILDGSCSSDPNDDDLTYNWSFTSRPEGSSATLSDPNDVDPTFITDIAGTYELSLTVNDGTEDSSPDTVIITVTSSQLDGTWSGSLTLEGSSNDGTFSFTITIDSNGKVTSMTGPFVIDVQLGQLSVDFADNVTGVVVTTHDTSDGLDISAWNWDSDLVFLNQISVSITVLWSYDIDNYGSYFVTGTLHRL